jgi:hypothetical protein
MNHTPGPWKYDPEWGTVMAIGPVQMKICDPPCQNLRGADGTRTPAETAFFDGNARLIAEAPELLQRLAEVECALQSWHHSLKKYESVEPARTIVYNMELEMDLNRAILAKATGDPAISKATGKEW